MRAGWFKLHRTIIDHPVFADADVLRLFIWCLGRAGYRESHYRGITIPIGSFVTGRIAAADSLGVSPSKFYRDLEKLVKLGCITKKSNNSFTVVTICNWGVYQSAESEGRTTDERPTEQRMSAQPDTSEEVNNPLQEMNKVREGSRGGLKRVPISQESFEVIDGLLEYLKRCGPEIGLDANDHQTKLNVIAAAERARAFGENPAALFVDLFWSKAIGIEKRDWELVESFKDQASRRLEQFESEMFGEVPF